MIYTWYWKLLNSSTGKLTKYPSAFMHGKEFTANFAECHCLIITTNMTRFAKTQHNGTYRILKSTV